MAEILEVNYDKNDPFVLKLLGTLIAAVRHATEYPTSALEEYAKRIHAASTGDLEQGILDAKEKLLFTSQLFDIRSEYLSYADIMTYTLMADYQPRLAEYFIDLYTRAVISPELLELKDGWYHFPLGKRDITNFNGVDYVDSIFAGENYVIPPQVRRPIAISGVLVDYNPDAKKAVVKYVLAPANV